MLSPCDPGFSSSSANRSPCRLAVPEKIFALFACLIFSTAADAPPRCIRHRRRSAPHPHPPRPLLYRISSHLSAHPKAPLCKGSWHGVAVTEGLPAKGNNFISPVGVAESPQGDRLHACPAGGYFSVKKSNQKSLGENPETPYASVRPDRKAYSLPDLGLDDAYKVFILIRSLLGAKIKCAAGTFATSLYTREAFAARWPQIVPRNKLIFPVNHSLISPILM